MKLKEIYEKNKLRRYCDIVKIKNENIILEAKPVEKIKENWIILLAILVLVMGLLLMQFNLTTFLVSLALVFILVLTFIYGNQTRVVCDKNNLYYEQGFQKNMIPYSKLKNVYMGRSTDFYVFIPWYSYKLVIRYEDNFNFLRELEVPLMCMDEAVINDFLNNFVIDTEINQRYVSYSKKRWYFKIASVAIIIIASIIVAWYLIKTGVINLNQII